MKDRLTASDRFSFHSLRKYHFGNSGEFFTKNIFFIKLIFKSEPRPSFWQLRRAFNDQLSGAKFYVALCQ
jgi:hypothetical protein